MAPLTFIDLFAGCGGFSTGLEQAGLKGVLHLESDVWACETLKANFSADTVLCADIREVKDDVIAEYKGVDVIVGGPPCQGFSVAGSTQFGVYDKRNELVLWFLHWVTTLEPQAVVIENVPQILTKKDRAGMTVMDLVQEKLRPIGYAVTSRVLSAADFGVPQLRRRAFIFAIKSGSFPILEATHAEHSPEELFRQSLAPYVTVGEALSDLPCITAGQGVDEAVSYATPPLNSYQSMMRKRSSGVSNHVAMRHTARLIERFSQIKPDESLKDVNPNFGQISYKSGQLNEKPFKYNNYRLNPNRPSLTIPASFQSLFLHPNLNRNLTAREAARLMSFPDRFVFRGKRTTMSWEKHLSQYNQIGNAVCPLVASAIGKALREILTPHKTLPAIRVGGHKPLASRRLQMPQRLSQGQERKLQRALQAAIPELRHTTHVTINGFTIPVSALALALLVITNEACCVCDNVVPPHGIHTGRMPFLISKDDTETLMANENDHGLDFHVRALLEINHEVAHLIGQELERLKIAVTADVINERTGRSVRGISCTRVPGSIESIRKDIFQKPKRA